MATNCELDDTVVEDFIEKNKATNTVRKTKSDLNVWYRWCAGVNEGRKLEELTPSELNHLMGHFFISVKKKNGEEYEPGSLTSYQRSIDRYLRDAGREISILTDREFEGSRRALEAKRKDLRREGKGRRQNAAEALTEGDEKCLWESGQLGDDNPHTLIHTIWYLCTMHFGWRGVDEHRRVCYGDFELGCDDEGVEFVQFKVERGTKTRTGCEGQQERAFNPRMYAHGGENCPVNLFKTYISHRPPHTTKDDSPFYLKPANIVSTRSNIWYKNQPVGINSLKKYMKTMTENAGISGKKTTNHSTRKTMITKLVQNDTNPLHVAQLTGHKNIKSLDSYSVASKKQQRDMSHLISGVRTSQIPELFAAVHQILVFLFPPAQLE